MTYLLVIDSGNTRMKWGLHDGNVWLKKGNVVQGNNLSLKKEWRDLPKPHKIIISNVSNNITKKKLSELLPCWKVKPEWITALAYQCGVRNYYARPSLLGSDRWAALIAAWKRQKQGCLVVDAGTAMTVDTLSDTGEFLGGIILPGLELMKRALVTNTMVPNNQEGKYFDFPDNTANAIHSGAVHALAGSIKRMSELFTSTLGHTPECIISGGESWQFLPELHMNSLVVDNLVLEGLVLIGKEIQK